MVGAVAGTPGTLPTTWGSYFAPSGLTRTVVGTGVQNGINYVDIRIAGTPSNTTEITFYLENVVAATVGQAWCFTAWVAISSGTTTNVAGVNLRNFQLNGGAYVRENNTAILSNLTSTLTRFACVTSSFGSGADKIQPVLSLYASNTTTAIDITIRIGLPQLEQGAFATSVIPTSGSTVTRAADVAGIYDDNFGVFRTNLLQYSEEFNNAAWTPTSTAASVTANAGTAPNGTTTADLIKGVSVAADQVYQTVTVANTTAYTLSYFIKSVDSTSTRIGLFSPPSTWLAFVDITWTAGVPSTGSTSGSPTNITYANFGDGWYRCSFTATTATTSYQIHFHPDRTNNQKSALLWGAQLEQGSTATDYIKSDVNFVSRASSATYYDVNGVIQTAAVDEARTAAYLPDGNGNFVSAGPLLLEPAGTNLLLQSENFGNTWIPVGLLAFGSGSTLNATTAPDGAITADLIVPSAVVGNHGVAVAWPGSGTRTLSIYAKPSGYSQIAFTSSTSIIVFDLPSKAVVATPVDFSSGSVTALGNGWYRVSAVITSPAGGNMNILVANSSLISFAGDGTSGIYLWGAQLEQSSHPTSYIPTTTSTVTRAADVSTSAATTVFESDWYRQDEGTVFAQYNSVTWNADPNFPKPFVIATDDNNSFWIGGTPDDNQYRYRVRNGGVNQFGPANMTRTPTLNNKTAMAIKAADFAVAADGGNLAAVSSGTVPTVNSMIIGSDISSTNWVNQPIRRLTYWSTRLGNEVLQTITQ